MNSVATWDLLTMTELCRNLKFSCRDLVSTTCTSLYRKMEKSCCDIKLLVAFALCRNIEKLCHDMGFSFTPVLYPSLSRHNSPFARASLSCAPKACHARLAWSVALAWLGKLCRDIKLLCRDKKSPFPGRLGCNPKHSIATPLYEILSRHKIFMSRNKIPWPQPNSVMTQISLLQHKAPWSWPHPIATQNTLSRHETLLSWTNSVAT